MLPSIERPLCKLYDEKSGKLKEFKQLIICLPDGFEVFNYVNSQSKSEVVLKRIVNHEYIAYFSKTLPSLLDQPDKKPERETSGITFGKSKEETLDKKNKCLIVFENLTQRYSNFLHENQFIVLAFKIKSHIYDETNEELNFIRNQVAEFHYRLKYSEYGIRCQVSERIEKILYKVVKYTLCYISDLSNISQELPAEEKLRQLYLIYQQPAYKEFVSEILADPKFSQELLSITYKTILTVGLFPACIELNTMNEAKLWLKIKGFFTNVVSAPYGSKHHASFSIGNHRYSFIFDPKNKDKQRVSINSEIKRGFSIKNRDFQYFRLKFFDFLPMDSWIPTIAKEADKLMRIFLTKGQQIIETDSSFKQELWGFVQAHCVDDYVEAPHQRIAKEFYERYRSELCDKTNDRIFRKMTQLISDAEMRGYSNLSNNCQTIVSEIVSLFCKNFSKIMEPLFDASKVPHVDYAEFLKFGAKFNYKFSYIGPFSMTFRLSYFDSFTDKDSSDLLCPKKFERIDKYIQRYLETEKIKEFLTKLEQELIEHSKIHITRIEKAENQDEQSKSNDNEQQQFDKLKEQARSSDLPKKHTFYEFPDLKVHSDSLFSFVSCLLMLKFNELFNIKRNIKIAKLYEEELEELTMDSEGEEENKSKKKKKEKSISRAKENADRLPELYKQKYQCQGVFRELCYYYYNSIRLAVKTKLNDTTSFIGFLISKKPDCWYKNAETSPVKSMMMLNSMNSSTVSSTHSAKSINQSQV